MRQIRTLRLKWQALETESKILKLTRNEAFKGGYRKSGGNNFTATVLDPTVVTKRMVKKQQMQWSQQGAHYLLQTRTATLNGDLPNYFERWYPGLKIHNDRSIQREELKKAA